MPDLCRLVVLVIGVVLATPACGRVREDGARLSELQTVQRQIGERAGTADVTINVTNGRFLWIRIANSPWESLGTGERRERALGVARLAYLGSASRFRPEVVTVTFAVRRAYVRFIRYSKTTSHFQFDAENLVARPTEPRLSEHWIAPSPPPSDLYLVPIGDVPPELMEDLASHLETRFRTRITSLSPLAFDRATFDPQRRQTVADDLIAAVRRRYTTLARDDRARVIGVTPFDMYMQEMADQWAFTFSLRSDDGRFAVVSYARMNPVNLGESPDDERLRTRLRKMVTKNVGIKYYGLPLSRDPRSVLYGQIGGVDDLDRISEYFDPR
jgi:predicted Zn-dependent protease